MFDAFLCILKLLHMNIRRKPKRASTLMLSSDVYVYIATYQAVYVATSRTNESSNVKLVGLACQRTRDVLECQQAGYGLTLYYPTLGAFGLVACGDNRGIVRAAHRSITSLHQATALHCRLGSTTTACLAGSTVQRCKDAGERISNRRGLDPGVAQAADSSVLPLYPLFYFFYKIRVELWQIFKTPVYAFETTSLEIHIIRHHTVSVKAVVLHTHADSHVCGIASMVSRFSKACSFSPNMHNFLTST